MSEYQNSAGRTARAVVWSLASILAVTLVQSLPAQAQFVCVNSGNSGDGATAGGPQGVACGTNANANSTGALNTAVGYSANAASSNGSAFGANSYAGGGGSTAIGYQSSATSFWSVAVGGSSSATHSFTAAVGHQSVASGYSSSAFGSFAGASANYSTAVGYQSSAAGENSFAAGAGATVTATGTNGVAVGNGAHVAGANGVAIGNGASAGFANSVAIGNGAAATRANQISTGTASSTYTMAGITSAASRSAQSGPTQIVTSDASGNLATQSLSDFGVATRQDIAAINNQLYDLTNRTNRAFTGVAMAFAMAGVPTLLPNEKVAMAFNYGAFEGANGLAFNIATRINEHIQFNAGIAYGPNEDIAAGRVGLRVGW
jgi:hypothetical protein